MWFKKKSNRYNTQSNVSCIFSYRQTNTFNAYSFSVYVFLFIFACQPSWAGSKALSPKNGIDWISPWEWVDLLPLMIIVKVLSNVSLSVIICKQKQPSYLLPHYVYLMCYLHQIWFGLAFQMFVFNNNWMHHCVILSIGTLEWTESEWQRAIWCLVAWYQMELK